MASVAASARRVPAPGAPPAGCPRSAAPRQASSGRIDFRSVGVRRRRPSRESPRGCGPPSDLLARFGGTVAHRSYPSTRLPTSEQPTLGSLSQPRLSRTCSHHCASVRERGSVCFSASPSASITGRPTCRSPSSGSRPRRQRPRRVVVLR